MWYGDVICDGAFILDVSVSLMFSFESLRVGAFILASVLSLIISYVFVVMPCGDVMCDVLRCPRDDKMGLVLFSSYIYTIYYYRDDLRFGSSSLAVGVRGACPDTQASGHHHVPNDGLWGSHPRI